MATFKTLLDAECGVTNPLIKLSQFYTHDGTLVTQNGFNKSSSNHFPNMNLDISSNTAINDLVNEYHKPIAASNTFHLDSLLANLNLSNKTIDSHACQWTKEFLNSSTNDIVLNLENNSLSSSVYSQWIPDNEENYISSFILQPNSIFLDQQSSLIDTEFDNNIITATQNILSFLQEKQFENNTEFITSINDKKTIIDEKQQEITYEMKDTNQINNISSSENNQTLHSQSCFEQFIDTYSEYKFTEMNPFFDYTNPFEEGLKRLQVHDIINAILFFEVAVQKKPDHINAWLYLGITQSENEQDKLAVCALKKCIELDSKNLQAYLTLSSCYVNEMLIKEAFICLYKWLENNDKYSHLLLNHRLYSIINNETKNIDNVIFKELQDLFLQAILLSNIPNKIDIDLQVCLGILFYLHDDYDEAVECFNIAVLAKPNDALLWNKLGASIGNSGHSEKAVNAYYHALTLLPGYIRARYNLGISCLNLNAYEQAIEHFLITLKQQNNNINTHIRMSEKIWSTLAIAINRLKRPDLEQYVTNKDLSKLLHKFNIE